MKNEQDYLNDLAEIRSIMERSSKFLSLSGLSGVLAGIYAIAGVWFSYSYFGFYPDSIAYSEIDIFSMSKILFLAFGVLILSVTTAATLSVSKAREKGTRVWNSTSRQMVIDMAVPLIAGGLLAVIFFSKGLNGLLIPVTLIFYGIALYNAGKFTFTDVKYLGIIQIFLGLLSVWLIEYSLIIWMTGFGIVHIVYGIYIHIKYER